VAGKVVRQYVGGGWLGQWAAVLDAHTRATREAERQEAREERDALKALEGQVDALGELADLLACGALLAAGFHQHKGEWRKRHEHHDDATDDATRDTPGSPAGARDC
jgi:hypothetical protein